MDKDEALRMALEALEIGKPMFDAYWGGSQFDQAITAIKEALAQPDKDIPKIGCVNHDCDKCKAQPEQEPVAVIDSTISDNIDWRCVVFPKDGTKLYTTPPQRTWEGLSVFEINDLVENTEYEDYRGLVEATEDKLKEKNT